MDGEHEILAALRRDMVLELEAINLYTEQLDRIQNEQFHAAPAHLIEEEKEHVAELTELINQFDEVQADEFTEPHPELIRQGQAELIQSEESEVLQAQMIPTEGHWTHDYPISLGEAREFGLPVIDTMPAAIYQLMELYPQPAQRRPTVEYIPIPYHPPGDGAS